jgi:hypothetical protein
MISTVKHIKTGKLYTLHGIVIDATNTTDGRRMALYSNSDNIFFVREISEFMEKFAHGDEQWNLQINFS